MPPFDNAQRNNRSDYSCSRRCIVDAYRTGSGQKLFRRTATPVPDDNNVYSVTVDAGEGLYDLMVWCDYTTAEHPHEDFNYITDNLHTITVVPEIQAGAPGLKDAACAFITHVSHGCDGSPAVDVGLERPLAAYRVIADDVAAYRRMHLAQPDRFPPLDELTVEVAYDYFVASSFNLRDNRPNDSATGVSYRFNPQPPTDFSSDDAIMIASDMIFASDTKSSVSLTIEIKDTDGNVISRASGVEITHRRGYVTTVTGSFLTLGVTTGGIAIDPAWREDIVIHF